MHIVHSMYTYSRHGICLGQRKHGPLAFLVQIDERIRMNFSITIIGYIIYVYT